MATKPTGAGRGAAKDRAHDYVKRQVLTGGFPGGELISEGEVAAIVELMIGEEGGVTSIVQIKLVALL